VLVVVVVVVVGGDCWCTVGGIMSVFVVVMVGVGGVVVFGFW
jgi:hypothetical protein